MDIYVISRRVPNQRPSASSQAQALKTAGQALKNLLSASYWTSGNTLIMLAAAYVALPSTNRLLVANVCLSGVWATGTGASQHFISQQRAHRPNSAVCVVTGWKKTAFTDQQSYTTIASAAIKGLISRLECHTLQHSRPLHRCLAMLQSSGVLCLIRSVCKLVLRQHEKTSPLTPTAATDLNTKPLSSNQLAL